MPKPPVKPIDLSFYKTVIDSCNDLIVRVNLQGEVLYANEVFASAFSTHLSRLSGNYSPHFSSRNNASNILSRLKKITKPPFCVYHEEKIKTGQIEKWIYWENSAVFNDDKNITGIQAAGRDITELKKHELELKKNSNLINSIARATQTLILNDYYKIAVNEALAILGEATGADRVNILEFHRLRGRQELLATQIFEWVGEGISSEFNAPDLQSVPIEEFAFYHKYFPNSHYQSVIKKIDDPQLKKMLEGRKIKSVLFIPIIVQTNLWGFIGYNDCTNERDWGKSEISYLTTVANVLGSTIQKEQLKEKLRQTEAQHRFSLETSGLGVWNLNLGGARLDLLTSPEEAGFTSTEEMISTIHPDDTRFVRSCIQNYIIGADPSLDFEARMKAWDGSYRLIRFKGRVSERDPDNIPTRLIGTYQDVTDERLRSKKIEENEARLKSLISVIPDNIFIISSDGVIDECFANEPEMLLGNARDLIGKNIKDSLPPNVAKESLDKINEALKTGKTLSHFYKLNVAGKNYFFEARIIPLGPSRVFSLVRNETNRINIEEELYDSQRSLEQAQQIARMGSWEKNLFSNKVLWSKETYRILGLNASPETASFETMLQRIHPDDRPGYVSAMNDLTGKFIPFTREFRIEHNNGEIRYVQSRGEVFYENNTPVKLFGTLLDITDIKLAEKAMHESELRYRTYIGESPVGIFVFNNKHELIEANKAAYELLGYRDGELTGKLVSDLIHPDSVHTFLGHFDKILDTGKNVCNLRLISTDGETREVSLSSSRLLRNEYVSFMQDVTATRQMIKELAENKERFDNYFSSLNDLIYFFDIKTQKAVFINEFRQRVLGIQNAKYYTEDEEWLELIHPGDRHIWQRAAKELYETKKTSIQYRIYDKEGKIRWLWDRNWLVVDAKNEPVRIEGIITDITQTKEYEEAMKVSLDKEKELNEMKSRFITTASHEFRTPLTTIFSSAELLENYSAKWPRERTVKHYNKIKDTVHKMRGILDELILLNKAESSNLKFEPMPLELRSFLEEMIDDFSLIKPANLEIKFVSGIKAAEYNLDANLLTQALRNLLGNAIKFSPKGGTVTLNVTEREENLIFTVTDQGIGIPADEIRQLFTKFYRTKNASAIDGTGLGLVIAKNAVEAHGGTISCLSRENEGTTFIFVLPVNN